MRSMVAFSAQLFGIDVMGKSGITDNEVRVFNKHDKQFQTGCATAGVLKM